MARNLHSHLGQQLTGAVLLLNLLQKNLKKQNHSELALVSRLSDLLADSRQQLRQVMMTLQPVGSTPDGLVVALKSFLGQASETFGVECQLENPKAVIVKSPLVANSLLHVAEQITLGALANLKLEKMVLLLARQKESISIDITSFDRGVSARGERAESRAIAAAGLRVKALGGKLSIRRLACRGARVRCLIPDQSTTSSPTR